MQADLEYHFNSGIPNQFSMSSLDLKVMQSKCIFCKSN